ncbi:uncharacterized protein YodC (DUF2158 family) [Spirosoma lacussanchae]|uniref:DUF2158 domain-containing protein n=1 Tax=Spirosoma lacussanchae TaxID=1884249 RepID=UPI0011081215|nr:DUF2158 domain-containing protein [Spirosoma lacussanchae]
MEAKFKLGDVVMLKSGSPTMTIDDIVMPFGDDDVIRYNATYFDETTKTFKKVGFKEFQLESYGGPSV